MALLDVARNLIVIRVVYDGPPEAGKTTSVRALASSLGKEVYSPRESSDGRTLYFDWMDYTGGRYEGYQIRCQIVTVPGQDVFFARRRRLIEDADVVVFVADSSADGIEDALARLRELKEIASRAAPPPVGIILQANKRDRPDALPISEVREQLDACGYNIGIVESVASESSGVRETFVFAVRLALDRVREMIRGDLLTSGVPLIDNGEDLMAEMIRRDTPAAASMAEAMAEAAEIAEAVAAAEAEAEAATVLGQVLAENAGERSPGLPVSASSPAIVHAFRPRPPDPSAPSGAIWPPVEGRLILHEASSVSLSAHPLDNGDWVAGLGYGWRVHSTSAAYFSDVEIGRATLIQWARLHAGCGSLLSPRRCVVLADAGNGTWRLWQVVRAERSLREFLGDLDQCSAEEAATRLLEAAAVLLEMESNQTRASYNLHCSLDTVGRTERGPMYIGLMPSRTADEPLPNRGAELVRSELEPVLYNSLWERRREILPAIERSRGHGSSWRSPDVVSESSGALLAAAARTFQA